MALTPREPNVVLHRLKVALGDEHSNEPAQCRDRPQPVKILIIDDHALIREAMHGVIGQLKRDACLLDAANCAQARRLVEEHADIDLILLDLTLPDQDGFSMLAELRESRPAMAVVVLSGSNERHDVLRALEVGAVGYIPKSTSHEVMLGALELVFSGGTYIPPEILRGHSMAKERGGEEDRLSPSELGLTERQAQVLALLREGKSNKAIARILGLAEPTVKNHITAVLKALNVTSRTEAVVATERLRLKLPRRSEQ
jgi:DNA-binding NarL/FixJ family response regulator